MKIDGFDFDCPGWLAACLANTYKKLEYKMDETIDR
jgi:hypothetical protein